MKIVTRETNAYRGLAEAFGIDLEEVYDAIG